MKEDRKKTILDKKDVLPTKTKIRGNIFGCVVWKRLSLAYLL